MALSTFQNVQSILSQCMIDLDPKRNINKDEL